MRTRTFVLSLFVHTTVIGLAMVVRIFATTELPDPPLATTFIMASAVEEPEVQPPPARVVQSSPPALNHDVAPTDAPPTLAPESAELPDRVPSAGDGIIRTPGDPIGDVLGDGPPPPAPRAVPAPPLPVRVGTGLRPPHKIHHVAPGYPDIARSARVSGVVILEALIGEDGSVRDVKVLRSVPLLDTPALEAVRQWRFTPTLLNGTPVQVIMTVTVSFTLN